MTLDLLSMTSHPIFRTSQHFTYDIKSTVSDLTATVSVSSHPHYRRHHSHSMEGIISSISIQHIPYVFDKISTKYDTTKLCVGVTTLCICLTTFALQMTSHPLYHTKKEYLWFRIHFRNDITPPVSDIAPTVSLSSQHLHWYHTQCGMTSQAPSVWHHIHYIYHHIQSLCHHTTVLMTSQPLYMKPHPVCRATYTLYRRHHSDYLGPHTHLIDNITRILCMTSHSPYMWHRLHYTRHHILILWPQTTVFISSQPLYLTSHPLYMCHHIHCIDDVTPTVFLISHQL